MSETSNGEGSGQVIGPARATGRLIPGMKADVTVRQSSFPTSQEVETFEKYEPGAFGRILSLAERGQAFSVEATKRAQDYAARDSGRGHWLGWSLALIAIISAVFEGDRGHTAVAIALLGLPVFTAAKSLIDSERGKK